MMQPSSALALKQDFPRVAGLLQRASQLLREKGYAYPLFLASTEPLAMGELLVPPQQSQGWRYYAAELGLLEQARLVTRSEAFLRDYPDADVYACVLLVDAQQLGFVHLPYPESQAASDA